MLRLAEDLSPADSGHDAVAIVVGVHLDIIASEACRSRVIVFPYL